MYASKESQERVWRHRSGDQEPTSEQGIKQLAYDYVAHAVLDKKGYDLWLDTPHPHLGDRTARECIESGLGGAVITMLANAMSGLPS